MNVVANESNGVLEEKPDTSPMRLALGSIALVPVSLGAAMLAQTPLLIVGAMAAFFAIVALTGAKMQTVHGRIFVALGLVGQAICITAALSGHPWQIDSHMIFFAVLAVCMVMSEPIVILVAAGAIAAHHLGLSLFLPSMVYPSFDLAQNLQRTAVHGVIVVVEAAFLWTALRARNRALANSVSKSKEAQASAAETRTALAAAEAARLEAETALRDTKEAQKEALEARAKAEAGTAEAIEADRKARAFELEEREKRAVIERDQRAVVETLRTALKHLANGDLSKQIDTPLPQKYEDLRADFNKAVSELREAIGAVQHNAGIINDDVGSVEAAAESLAKRTESQAATLEESTAAISQIAVNSQQSAKSAQQADEIVRTAKTSANSSDEIVRNAVQAMGEIEESSGKISKIVDVIEDIAFQTNLLALNAGVEAARAGDKGRGFSVVASEVRELAQRSSEAAREIGSLIENSEKQVATGVQLVSDTGVAISKINAAVGEISSFVAKIKVSAEEQSLSISQTNDAMVQLENVTQQNAAMFEESNAVTHSLAKQAGLLQTTLGRFEMGAHRVIDTPIHERARETEVPSVAQMERNAPAARLFEGNVALAPPEEDLDSGWEEF